MIDTNPPHPAPIDNLRTPWAEQNIDTPKDRATFPPGYAYSDNLLETLEDQIQHAWESYDYQQSPVPSFEETPSIDIKPAFNPTNVDESALILTDWSPESLRRMGWKPHSEFGNTDPVKIWRFIDLEGLQDGTGITSSSVLEGQPVKDHPRLFMHLASNQATRTGDGATPFVSFTTNPEYAAEAFISRQFGSKDGRNSVVIQATVNPNRILSHGKQKDDEVLLLGGLGASEYDKAMQIDDFTATIMEYHRAPVESGPF